jgi:hypothetical protein
MSQWKEAQNPEPPTVLAGQGGGGGLARAQEQMTVKLEDWPRRGPGREEDVSHEHRGVGGPLSSSLSQKQPRALQ